MQIDCPDPKEVSDFHFLQLRTLRIVKENEHNPTDSINIVASASKYGLLFIGVERGFKVIQLEDVLTVDEDKENRSIVDNYPFKLVSCDTPTILAVNASQSLLAVGVKNTLGIAINLYHIASFPASDAPWQPFCSNAVSSPGLNLLDFLWNPVSENVYSFCLSDGSLYIHEVSVSSVKVTAQLPTAKAMSVCWSPKGKQLVAGKQDGCFTQYKPTLEAVNNVMPPAFEGSPVSVSSICWISNTVFAVVYVTDDAPNFFIVSTPKGSAVTYTNFNDVCLGNCNGPNQKYLMHFEPSWGILICASFDSIEIAVLGDMPNCIQWDLKEDGKALLPGKDGATNAVGMAVMYSAQRQIVISDCEMYPPMPVMFILTNNGLLVSFHMINTKSGAPSLVSAPQPVEFKNSENAFQLPNELGDVSQIPAKHVVTSSSEPFISSAFVAGKSAMALQTPGIAINSTFSLSRSHEKPSSITENQNFSSSPNKPEIIPVISAVESQGKSQFEMNPVHFSTEKQNEVSSSSSSFMTAIISEIQSFEKELQDLKQLQNSSPVISGEEDMAALKVFALNLHNFQKNIAETMQSISSDIYTLKNVLLESFVMVEEASSREKRRNDHSYITLLKERALDPITAKRMQKMHQHYQYLSSQLQEVNDKLDQDWIRLMSSKKKSLRNNPYISSTEAIYKTIVNNQKIIHNLKRKVDILLKRADEKKLQNTTKIGNWRKYHKRSTQEDLSKLADEFLQVKIVSHDEGEVMSAKKLSQESQDFLKDFLRKSNVITVRPTAVYSPSQSRLLSNAMPSEDYSAQDQEQNISPKTATTSSRIEIKEKEVTEKSSLVDAVKTSPLPTHAEESSTVVVNKRYTPICEPVTPPEARTSAQPLNKNLINSNLLRENFSAYQVSPQFDASAMVNPGVSSSLLTSTFNNNDESQKFSFTAETKPFFSQASSNIFSAPVFSQSFSFMSSPQVNSESFSANPLTATSTSTPLKSFQFEQKKESVRSSFIATSSSSQISTIQKKTPEPKTYIASESSKFTHEEVSLEPLSNISFSAASSFNSGFSFSAPKPPPINTPSVDLSENKKSFDLPVDKSHTDTSNTKSISSFFSTSNNAEQIKNKNSADSITRSSESHTFPLNLVNKAFSANSEKPIISEQNAPVKILNPTISKSTSIVPPNQSVLDIIKKNSKVDSDTKTNVESSELSSPKPLVSSSDVLVPKSEKASSVPEKEFSVYSAPPPPTTTSVTPTSSVTKVESVIPPPITTVSTSSPALPTLSPQTTTVPSSGTTFGLSGSAFSLDSSEDKKSGASTAPSSDTKPAQTFGLSEALAFLPSAKTDAPSFNQTSVTQATAFGQPASIAVTQATSFGQPEPTAVTQATSFGHSASTAVTQTASFGQPASTAVTQTASFGQPASTAVTQTASFGQPTSTAITQTSFGQPTTTVVTQANLFGQPSANSSFSSAAGGFFGQTPSFGSGDAASTVTTSNSDFSGQSTFSFGKPAFGQTSGSFGLAKSLFGQSTTAFTQSLTASSFSFSQNSTTFGQGSFFSGLGGKPSEENASKNVFGITGDAKPADTSIFKNTSVTSFGAVNSGSFSTPGSFSSGGGSVAQTGFGSFQQSASQQQGGFGAAPTFGGSPAFGSPAFGAAPSFGSGNALSSVFGQQQVSSNFSNFATASSPTFGSLASQGSGFGSPPQMGGFGSQPAAFGSPPSFGSTSFGQPSSFGSPSSPPSNSSAFTQWRN